MRLGVLDIGSNTGHLQLVDAYPGARPIPFASHKEPLQLVTMLDSAGDITESGQKSLIAFVSGARKFASAHKADDLLAFCTSAIREAGNGAKVIERIRETTGIVMTELSGPQEAAATFQAVRRWFGWGAGNILNLDIGGGSLEIAIGKDELPSHAASVPLGAARLTRDWLPEDPPSAKSVKILGKYIRETLAPHVKPFTRLGQPNMVVGTSKTFRSLARMTGAAPSGEGSLVRRELRLHDLRIWTKRLTAMSVADRVNLDGVSALRARQVLAGAMVAEAAMEKFGVNSLEICPWALREGLILRRFDTLMFESAEKMPTVGVGHVELMPLPLKRD